MIIKHDIETLYVAHSLTLRKESIALPALKKCEDYIARRSSRDKQLEKIAFLLARGNLGKFDLNMFYDFQTEMNKKVLSKEHIDYFKYMLSK